MRYPQRHTALLVREFGWSRTRVTSGNAISKPIVGPLFGFVAGWVIGRFGPRRDRAVV